MILHKLIEQHAINRAPAGETFTTVSGKLTTYYVDMRTISLLSGESVRLVGEAMFSLIPPGVKYVGAVPTAGLPLVPAVLLASDDLRGFYVREKSKGHGLGRMIEGHFGVDAPCVLLEDTVTTGGSLLKAVQTLRDNGATITHAVALFDRQEGAAELLAQHSIKLLSCFKAADFDLHPVT